MATGNDPPPTGKYTLFRSQTGSDFSDTSSMSESKHLFEDERQSDKEQTNVPMTSFNFINSIIGSGIIGIPFAMKQAGFGLGIILLILVAMVTDYSIILLIEAGKLSNTNTYQDMMLVACGRPGFYLLTFLQFVYPFIAMVSYNVIIGDTITKIIVRIGGASIADTILGSREFIIFLVTLLVTLPLSLYRNITKLSKWAFVSLVLVGVILLFICIRLGTFALKIPATEDAWSFANVNITQAIGIMAFAYMCHHNTFLIHASLENPTTERWNFVTHVSVMFCMVFMLVFGLIGYASFTGWTQGDLLENYCQSDDFMNVARFGFAFTIMLTYPIECFVTREVVENAIFSTNEQPPLWRHIVVTVVINGLVCALSMSTDCLGIVLELNGVMAAAPLAFIIPPLCVMKLRQEPILSKNNIIPIFITTFGTLVAVIGFIMAVFNFSEGNQCSHGKDIEYCINKNIFTNSSSSATLTTAPV
ncbi:putative sodium-coupled neutral amino acid transporter 11 isoform X2 [Ruditapes philippinarum]|uniref:putative sodium-coupled neutral amino acid transporter 11 isoform X2 n=1 Tax=Ruditapes philippinarum TaxID=129788 RepID=UPI00295AFF5E|nr:putative sodium-coupled neutral amino acid transporter 11 isoform X2 [Ruditapes philippinarum]XP_060581491.1 putative sodium-coupled neutral amino acid transporter 11 isoform X2 [Ruditapes philippinarum]